MNPVAVAVVFVAFGRQQRYVSAGKMGVWDASGCGYCGSQHKIRVSMDYYQTMIISILLLLSSSVSGIHTPPILLVSCVSCAITASVVP